MALRLAGFEARYGAGAMGPGHLLLALSWISDESLPERFDDPDRRRELTRESELLRERFAEAGIDPDELRNALRAALSAHAREELLRDGVEDDECDDADADAAGDGDGDGDGDGGGGGGGDRRTNDRRTNGGQSARKSPGPHGTHRNETRPGFNTNGRRNDSVLTRTIRRAGELGVRGHAGVIELLRAILEQPLPSCREVFEVLGVDDPLYAFFPEIPRPRPEPSPDAPNSLDIPDHLPGGPPESASDPDSGSGSGSDSNLDLGLDPDYGLDLDLEDSDRTLPMPDPATYSASATDPAADPDLASDFASDSGTADDPEARLVERTTRVPRRPRHAVDEARTPLLDRYGRDLTLLAREGSLSPLIGREAEMLSLARVLVRQRKANAVLVGEAGVGKTGIVEGLATRLAAQGAPTDLTNVRIVELTMSALVAGTKYRGEFEERMEAVLKEARDTPGLVLFLDELHTVLGAGAATGATDAASILKPMLARSEIRVIGATTASEYQRYVEEDPALQRRFAVIWVEEPTRGEAVEILEGVAEHIARHHRVEISPEAPAAAVELAMRYLPDQHLPDKAIDLLDQACAAARIPALTTVPNPDTASLATAARTHTRATSPNPDTADLATPAHISTRATPPNPDTADLAASTRVHTPTTPPNPDSADLAAANRNPTPTTPPNPDTADLAAATPTPTTPSNSDSADHLTATSGNPASTIPPNPDTGDLAAAARIAAHAAPRHSDSADLAVDPLDLPLSHSPAPPPAPIPISTPVPAPILVSRADLISVVAERARIPVERVALTEAQRLLDLEQHLSRRVIGQQPAVSAVAEAVRASRAGLGDPRRPIGVFLLAGPTGSGKTELAKALAEFLFDDEQRLIRIDMSEYQDKYTVSRLLGAPPGYLGHDREGQLSGPLRAHPHSVVLFDEVEKAHPEVLDLFLQILDEGRLTDARGRRVSFTETVVMMTTNLGYERGTDGTMGFRAQGRGTDAAPSAGPARIMAELRRVLRPELLGRVSNVVVFNPLPRAALEVVLDKLIARVHNRLADRALTLELDRPARDLLLNEGSDPRSGARALEQTVERLLVQPLGRELLSGTFLDGTTIRVTAKPMAEPTGEPTGQPTIGPTLGPNAEPNAAPTLIFLPSG